MENTGYKLFLVFIICLTVYVTWTQLNKYNEIRELRKEKLKLEIQNLKLEIRLNELELNS
jgi:hypothetical protein